MRIVELQRLFGKTEKIREKGAALLSDYAAGDVDPAIGIEERSPFLSLITKLKMVMGYCTLTEISFATNCTNKCHDKNHFADSRNHRYYGYAQKIRENEIQIFKKRFSGLKKKMLQHFGISTKQAYGNYENVYEIYLPFEEWTKNAIYKKNYQWKYLEKEIEKNEKFGFLQYLKSLEKEMLVDYYFARRESKIFKNYPIEKEKYKKIEEIIDKKDLDSYYGSLDYLKKNFRSIYVALSEKSGGRKLIRTTKKNLLAANYPEHMEEEADLFLVRKNYNEIVKRLSPGHNRTLNAFLTNFDSFEKISWELGEKIGKEFEDRNPEKLLFLYNQYQRKQKREGMFEKRWKLKVRNMTNLIAGSYRRLAYELKNCNANVIDIKGDYLFVTADSSIQNNDYFYIVRKFDNYEIEKTGKKKETRVKEKKKPYEKNEQLLLF